VEPVIVGTVLTEPDGIEFVVAIQATGAQENKRLVNGSELSRPSREYDRTILPHHG
jgi:hypothetical protein